MTNFKLLSAFTLCLSLSLLFSSCQEEKGIPIEPATEEILQDYSFFKDFVENVAITDYHKLQISENEFVCELTFQNFGESKILPEGLGFNKLTLLDNGEDNDRIANDGIYTSSEKFSIEEYGHKVTFEPVIDEKNFNHKEGMSISNREPIGCEFEPCGCPCDDGSCPACNIFGWSCWEVVSCSISFP